MPFRRHAPGDKRLIINISRLIIAGCGQTAQHVFAGLVAQAVHHRIGAVAVPYIQLCAQQTGTQAGLERLRTLVRNVQDR